jgi:DNA-binding CsgD family transcriptional regulator
MSYKRIYEIQLATEEDVGAYLETLRHLEGVADSYGDAPLNEDDRSHLRQDLPSWVINEVGHRVMAAYRDAGGTEIDPTLIDHYTNERRVIGTRADTLAVLMKREITGEDVAVLVGFERFFLQRYTQQPKANTQEVGRQQPSKLLEVPGEVPPLTEMTPPDAVALILLPMTKISERLGITQNSVKDRLKRVETAHGMTRPQVLRSAFENDQLDMSMLPPRGEERIDLTNSEQELLRLLFNSYDAIATELGMSKQLVEEQMDVIKQKLGVRKKEAVYIAALREGYLR